MPGGPGRRPGRRTRIGGKRGRRTWLLLKTTASSKRSSTAWTRSSTPGVLLGRYPILRILFTRRSSRFLSYFLAKPHQAGEAYKSRTRVVALATSCRAVRRRHCVGGGAPVNFGRRRRAAGPKKSAAARRGRPKIFFSKIHEKISFYPQNFLRNFFSHQSFEVCR